MASLKRTEYAILCRRCVEMERQNWPQHQIAKALGLSKAWVGGPPQRPNPENLSGKGAEGIASYPAPDNNPKLSLQQVQTLLKALNQGAESHGFAGHVWTRKRVNAVIEKRSAAAAIWGHLRSYSNRPYPSKSRTITTCLSSGRAACADAASIHRCQAVKDWLSANSGRIHLEQLPAYSPELNTVEFLWSYRPADAAKTRPKKHSVYNVIRLGRYN